MYKNIKYFFIYLVVIFFISACDNKIDQESKNIQKEQVQMLYQWLEGDWKGDLSVHAMEESFSAELKYSNGKLEIFAKEYCNGKAEFLSMQNKQELSVRCGKNTFMVSPANKEGKIYNINNTENKLINAVYIQHFEGTKFAGFLGKE